MRYGWLIANAADTPLPGASSVVALEIIIYRRSFRMILRYGIARNAIIAVDPAAKIDKLAAFRTEGSDRIVFPLDCMTTDWALHEIRKARTLDSDQGCGPFDQDSPLNKLDRTLTSHCVQAHRYTFSSGPDDGSYFPVRERDINKHTIWFTDAITI
jgi:hypothetical protein